VTPEGFPLGPIGAPGNTADLQRRCATPCARSSPYARGRSQLGMARGIPTDDSAKPRCARPIRRPSPISSATPKGPAFQTGRRRLPVSLGKPCARIRCQMLLPHPSKTIAPDQEMYGLLRATHAKKNATCERRKLKWLWWRFSTNRGDGGLNARNFL